MASKVRECSLAPFGDDESRLERDIVVLTGTVVSWNSSFQIFGRIKSRTSNEWPPLSHETLKKINDTSIYEHAYNFYELHLDFRNFKFRTSTSN